MDEDPARASAARRTRRSCAPPRRSATARPSAMISAGNTGATMASALLRMGRIKGVSRPADRHADPGPRLDARRSCSTPAPTPSAARVAGAVRPDGRGLRPPPLRHRRARRSACCRSARSRARATRCARRPTSCSAGAPGIDFIGNVEGRDIMTDDVDVVVTDGFTGNVVLKTLEGGMKADRRRAARRRSTPTSTTSRTPTR